MTSVMAEDPDPDKTEATQTGGLGQDEWDTETPQAPEEDEKFVQNKQLGKVRAILVSALVVLTQLVQVSTAQSSIFKTSIFRPVC